jgi:O-antigen ligase
VRVWQIALELIGDRPWLGWGLGNYKILYPSFPHDPEYDVVFHPHNFWLLLGAEAGIPVAIAFTVWVGYLCYRAVRVLLQNQLEPPVRSILLAYLLGFAGCIAFAFFDVTFYDARTNIVDWVLLAGIYSLTQSLDFN